MAELDSSEPSLGGHGEDSRRAGASGSSAFGDYSIDSYTVSSPSDVVEAADDSGLRDTVYSFISYSLVENGTVLRGTIENLTLFGNEDLTGAGNHLDNLIHGNNGANGLFGGSGSDTLFGNQGDDTLNGGPGDDELIGGPGSDLLTLDEGNDTVRVELFGGHDTIAGFDGDPVGGQDVLSLDALFDGLGFAVADRASSIGITDNGSTVEIRIDVPAADDLFLRLQTADDIAVGSDILVS
jgi:Ca2+-binding RTX toxin-like protein